MSANKTSICTSYDLLEAARLRGVSLEYDSFSAYVVALIRMDIIEPDKVDHVQGRKINGLGWQKKQQIESAMLRKEKEAAACWEAVETAEIKDVEALLQRIDTAPRGQLRVVRDAPPQPADRRAKA